MARHTRSCPKPLTAAPSAVNALHSPTPKAMTARRDLRSPTTPSGSAASDSTITYAEPSQPSSWSVSASSRFSGWNSENDVAVGVVEEVDQRQQPEGVDGV